MSTLERDRVRVTPDGRLSRNDAATFLGLSARTLADWAVDGKGPPMVRIGGRIFYRLADLEAIAQGQAA